MRSIFVLCVLCLLPLNLAAAMCFDEAGKKHGISPQLLRAIDRTESGMRQNAENRNPNGSYDVGVMQINSFWFPKHGVTADQLKADPCLNVMIGADILGRCVKSYDYAWEAVGCYNAHSHAKRVDYSWRIFRSLKAESRRGQASAQETTIQTGKNDSSLQFAVRDREL
ncbi:MAG TPA: lytic transglycosylase domain-containing protein [Dissulfurispiraceae bacterium]|nr:lytic transglycosylase domain-containing protein [Dissulfurispiraceae bacterium]